MGPLCPSVHPSATILGCLVCVILFLAGVELRHFFHLRCVGVVWFCVICNSQQFSFFYIQTLHNDYSHIEDVHLSLCTPFMCFFFLFGVLNLIFFSVKCLDDV